MFSTRVSRRTLLKTGAIAGAGLLVPVKWLANAPPAAAFSQSQRLRKFIQPMRGVGASGIPLAQPDTVRQPWWQPGVTHYTIDIRQFEDQLHPDLPNPTRLWGFGQGNAAGFRHLGGIIAAKRGTPVQITFGNNLPQTHILPVDRTIMGTEWPDNRTDVHLHGGLTPWTSDGGPFAWWDPTGLQGPSFQNNEVLRPGPGVPPNEAEYYYPNGQGARFVWYHDHSVGITRLNAYAGMASGYVIYDDYELALAGAPTNVPGPLDPRTIYMVFQDKIFVSATNDPWWLANVAGSRPGDLWYPHEYDTDRWKLGPNPTYPLPNPSVVPEMFGDTILVNGTAYPYLEVERREYRFRLLNACQARFLNPRLVYATSNARTEPSGKAGPAFVQFGTEGGFLPAPVYLSGASPTAPGGPTPSQLLLGPAERADLIVDFRDVPPGLTLLLVSDAPGPYPMGDPINDYFPGNPSTTSSTAGHGPNTRTLLQIRVKARKGAADAPISLPATLTPSDPFAIPQTPGVPTPNPAGVSVRRVTLNEGFDDYGRLIQVLGTDAPGASAGGTAFGQGYLDNPTEVVTAGSSEVWEILNLTGDTHPMHFHLVNVGVLSRQPFDAEGYSGGAPTLTGNAHAPDANELGWKETVRCNPGEVTRVWMKFDLPAGLPFKVPNSKRLAHDYGIQGAEYVWHCHILDHEEHDMMRPLVVTS